MSTNDGGPAFPMPGVFDAIRDRIGPVNEYYDAGGMALRDYFAAQALAGIMANPVRWQQIAEDYKSGKKSYEQCSTANAVKAYSIADAMLAARGKG